MFFCQFITICCVLTLLAYLGLNDVTQHIKINVIYHNSFPVSLFFVVLHNVMVNNL